MVQIGDAGVTDVVTGAETTTLSGTLREHTGGSLMHLADRVETTVGGRMSFSTMGEDSVLLGGPMTDTWTGGTFILAVMSDDLCAGVGTRVTAPVDLWLNALTGMEERPGTTAADGVFAEAYGTLFEREYGSGTHAAGVACFNGTTFQTQKSGFRTLMKVARGVRNLIPGSGAPASETPPPSPPSDPASVASGALAVGGMVMVGGAAARTTANITVSADNLIDIARVGSMAGDVDNAADLRHAADSAAQLDELRTAANQGGDLGDARRLDDMGEENPYDEIGGGANRGDSSSPEDSYSTVDESNPNRGDPGGVESDYSTIDGSDPNAGNPGGAASPEGTPPVLPSANRMEDQVRKAKTDLGVEWKKQYTELFAEARRIEATEPGRADALRIVGTELLYAADAVAKGEDARPNLAFYAKYLDELGFPEEAAKLRKASEAFTQFVESMRGLGPRRPPHRDLPSGVSTPDLHAWKSNPPIPRFDSEGKKIKKKVSFGDARQITFRIEVDAAESEIAGKLRMVATEPASTVDDTQAIRVALWDNGERNKAYKWWRKQRPGFLRKGAPTPGKFPFSVREQFLNALMQGRVDDSILMTLGRRFDSTGAGDGRQMALLSKTFGLSSTGDPAPLFAAEAAGTIAQSIDSKSLAKLLDLFESGATLA